MSDDQIEMWLQLSERHGGERVAKAAAEVGESLRDVVAYLNAQPPQEQSE